MVFPIYRVVFPIYRMVIPIYRVVFPIYRVVFPIYRVYFLFTRAPWVSLRMHKISKIFSLKLIPSLALWVNLYISPERVVIESVLWIENQRKKEIGNKIRKWRSVSYLTTLSKYKHNFVIKIFHEISLHFFAILSQKLKNSEHICK